MTEQNEISELALKELDILIDKIYALCSKEEIPLFCVAAAPNARIRETWVNNTPVEIQSGFELVETTIINNETLRQFLLYSDVPMALFSQFIEDADKVRIVHPTPESVQ